MTDKPSRVWIAYLFYLLTKGSAITLHRLLGRIVEKVWKNPTYCSILPGHPNFLSAFTLEGINVLASESQYAMLDWLTISEHDYGKRTRNW